MSGSRARWGSLILIGGLLVAAAMGADASPRKARPTSNPASRTARAAAHRTKGVRDPAATASFDIISLEIAPGPVTLDGPRAAQHVVVTGTLKDGSRRDVTESVTLVVGSAKVAKLASGVLLPVADGQTRLLAKLGHIVSPAVAVTVKNAAAPVSVQFVNDVMPILAKAGCNSTACHGSPAGKAGFKLSLFGYEPAADREAIVTDANGRRVDLKDPAKSLILQKPTMSVPHGGGTRFKVGSPEYQTVLAWLKAGTPGLNATEARVQKVTVLPDQPWLPAPGTRQHLLVSASLSDGSIRDVTDQALFSSNDDAIADVNGDGIVTARRPGETAVMVRYLGQVAVARIAVLPPWKLPQTPKLAQNNFIDLFVQAKLRKLRIVPSDLCTDEEFIRRATLDTCGIIPTVEEVRTFVADTAPDKRARLIDQLLERPEFVDFWTLKWNDALRNNPRLTREGLLPYSNWIREQVKSNRPFDQFVRDLLTASGKNSPAQVDPTSLPPQVKQNAKLAARITNLADQINDTPFNPAANYFVVTRDPLELTSATSQTFLGVRIECARCHNHPFEKWTQNDYYHLAAFFNGINVRGTNQTPRVVNVNERAKLRDPKTNEVVEPRTLDGTEVKLDANADRRAVLAEWITSRTNPYFARATVNRIWAHYFGRGIVEPIDDFRVTNPPSHPELLTALASEFADHSFDVKRIHRLILNSRTYQQSSRPNATNRQDTANFARFYPKRLMAEQLYDSLSQATGAFLSLNQRPQRPGQPAAGFYGQQMADLGPITRVAQLPFVPAGRRGQNGNLKEFLDMFGKPRREVVCSCERSTDGNVGQALALVNGDEINNKIAAPEGRVQRLIRDQKPDGEAIQELYLATLSRQPTAQEQTEAMGLLHASKSRAEGLQDLMWSLLNSREFLFVH